MPSQGFAGRLDRMSVPIPFYRSRKLRPLRPFRRELIRQEIHDERLIPTDFSVIGTVKSRTRLDFLGSEAS